MSDNTTHCTQCGENAYVNAQWQTSGGPQEADLCQACMRDIWAMFKHSKTFILSEPT